MRCKSCGARLRDGAVCCGPVPVKELTRPDSIAVVVPVGETTIDFTWEAVESLHRSTVPISIYVVADNVSLPELPPPRWPVRLLQSETRVGPYAIANAIARDHAREEWLGIQDGDDISFPTRFRDSLRIAEEMKVDQIAGSMINFLDSEDYDNAKLKMKEGSILKSGLKSERAPFGNLINATRLIRMSEFRGLNGFATWSFTADTEFDYRSQFSGVKSFASDVCMGLRRLHSKSATHGGSAPLGSPARQALFDELHRRMHLAPYDAFELGAMNQAPKLKRISRWAPRCDHRGDVIGVVKNRGCALTIDVHGCDLHTSCVCQAPNRPVAASTTEYSDGRSEESQAHRVCSLCPDRTR